MARLDSRAETRTRTEHGWIVINPSEGGADGTADEDESGEEVLMALIRIALAKAPCLLGLGLLCFEYEEGGDGVDDEIEQTEHLATTRETQQR